MKLLHFALCSLNLGFLHSLIIGVDDFIYHISLIKHAVGVGGGGDFSIIFYEPECFWDIQYKVIAFSSLK